MTNILGKSQKNCQKKTLYLLRPASAERDRLDLVRREDDEAGGLVWPLRPDQLQVGHGNVIGEHLSGEEELG